MSVVPVGGPGRVQRLIENPALAPVVFGALAFLWMWPVSLQPQDTIADVGDPLHLAYIMAWNAHQLVRDPLHLFDANSFFPWRQSLAFADHLLPESILVAPVQWLFGNAALSYNVAVFAGLFMSALFMRWLILEATGSRAAALAAGVAYAFNGFTLIEVNRVQVIHLQWWPLALLFLGRFVAEPTAARALGLAFALALQGLSGTYYLAFSALVAPFWLGLAYAGSGRRPSLVAVRRLAVAAAVSAVPVALMVLPYLIRGLPRGRVSSGVDLLAYLSPKSDSPMWSWLLPSDSLGREFKGLIGLALIGLGLFALARTGSGWRRALGLIAFVTGGLGVVLSMGDSLVVGGVVYGPGPHRFLLQLLPLEGLRHTPRFNALAVLGGAILVGTGAAFLLDRFKGASPIVLALVLLLPFEHWSPSSYGMRLPASEALRRVYRDLPQGPLVDLPLYPLSRRRFWAAYPYLSTYHWNPVLIGRTSFYPAGHEFLAWLLQSFPDPNSVGVLSRLGVQTLVIHPLVWPEEERQTHLQDLERDPALVRMERPAVSLGPNDLDLGEERYFQLARAAETERLCEPAAEIPAEALQVYPMGTDTPVAGLDRMTDRDPDTRWSSGGDQSGWYGFQVRLTTPQRLAAVAIETPTDRFPRVWPSLELRTRGGGWESAPSPFTPEMAWETLQGQLNGAPTLRMVVRFEGQDLRAFRLIFPVRAEPPTSNFEVSELRAFGECRPRLLSATKP